MTSDPLLNVSTHFRFGENWAEFSKLIDLRRITAAENSVADLLQQSLEERTFLDIGCGSGLFSLAASRLGAKRVLSVDIDPLCVETTKALRTAHGTDRVWDVRQISVFDTTPQKLGRFDVVYSWGALHHTGDMWRAIRVATSLVESNGMLAIAIYLKTPFCRLWRSEKRLYSKAPRLLKSAIFRTYKIIADTYSMLQARDKSSLAARGMNQDHDYKDWLGGYPYESASPEEIEAFVTQLGFQRVRTRNTARRSGLMGTGCAEYVFRRL